MKNRKIIFTMICLLLSASLSVPAISADEEIIRIGFFMLAPQVFIEKDGKPPIGAAVDYWEEYLAPEMKVNVEWVGPVNIRRLTKEALKGRIDAILVFAKNPERLKNFDFPDHSYTQMVAGLAFRKDHPLDKITSVEDLKGTVIGFHVDAIIPPVMRVDFIKWKWNYEPNWKEQNFALAIRKRIDAAFDAMSISLEYEAIQLGFADQLKILQVPGTELKNYTAFPKSGNGYFLKKYNAAHNKLRKEVDYDDIVKKYMKYH